MATNALLHSNIPMMTVKGLFHELDIYPDHLVIHRTDFLSRVFGGDEVISYNDILSLHVHNSSFLNKDWSQLVIVFKNGKSRALSYGAKQQHIAQTVKDTIEDFLSRRQVAPLMKSM